MRKIEDFERLDFLETRKCDVLYLEGEPENGMCWLVTIPDSPDAFDGKTLREAIDQAILYKPEETQ